MTALITIVLLGVVFLGPLAWRVWRDRVENQALELQAEIQAAVNSSLGGESFVAVRVSPGPGDHTGTVELLVPSGWEETLEHVWRVVLPLVPAGYALVFRPSPAAVRPVRSAPRAA